MSIGKTAALLLVSTAFAYWRGSVWVPTAYAALRGLIRYGVFDLARRQTVRLLEGMLRVYRDFAPHTIWECYAPTGRAPGRQICDTVLCRTDFCGWSALAPIAMFIESAIGIHSVDAFGRKVCWSPDTRFGGITASMVYENGSVRVAADAPFTLEIDGVPYAVTADKQRIVL